MISIITPVYNGRRFIEACIRAVIDQACPDVEHVIVDGGSTDGTVEIIRLYAERYPHIRWVSERDRGQSDAMNKGIAMARGNILGFLNVDDYYESNVLNRVSALFRTLPEPGLLVGNCNVWDTQGNLFLVNKPTKLKLVDLLMGPSVNPMPLNPSAYFYHASLHQIIGFYKVDEHYTLDWDFLLKAVQVANIKYVDEIWGNFRMIEGTKTLQDMQSGLSSARQERILKTYRKDLPRTQYWIVTIRYLFFTRVSGTIKYFWSRPREIPWRLKARLKKLLSVR